MYFKFEQRLSGAKDTQSAEAAFIQWFLSFLRLPVLLAPAGPGLPALFPLERQSLLGFGPHGGGPGLAAGLPAGAGAGIRPDYRPGRVFISVNLS